MRKEDFYTLIVYALMFVIALFIGLQIVQPALSDLGYFALGDQYTFASIVIVVGIVVNVVLIELGHVLGALIGGYRILSINVLGLCIYRTQEKWKFGFKSFQGLTGETRILAKKENASPRLHLFGPSLMVLTEFVVAILLYVFTRSDQIIHHGALIVAGIGVLLLIYNIMPFKLDTMTDGYYLMMLSKKINIEAYNELIRIESLIYENKSLGDIKLFDQITTLTSRVNMYKIYDYIDKRDFANALTLIDLMITNKNDIEVEVSSRAYAQKLYIILMTKTKEEADKFWFEEMSGKERKFVSNDISMESLRAYLLYNGVVTRSESECEFVINRVPKAVKQAVDTHRRDIEIKLFQEALKIVKDNNPEWQLEEPVLKIKK